MAGQYIEYRYSSAARKRAALWLVIGVLLCVALLVLLVTAWNALTLVTRIVTVGLIIALLFTVRAQNTRLTLRCLLWPDRLQMIAPLAHETIAWKDISEVRRVYLRQATGRQRWACTVLAQTIRGAQRPYYLFDDHLEQGEDALRKIVSYTPQAKHVNI